MEAVNIAFACYPVKNLKISRQFYEGVLGLKATSKWVTNEKSGMVEYDIGPTTLAIGAGAKNFKVGAVVAIEVNDFWDTIKSLKGRKCKFVSAPTDSPVCNMATVADPDGNKIMIHQRKS